MRSTKKTGILILSLALLAGLAGTMACQKKAAETPAAEGMKGVTEFEGTVRAALGRYMYLSTAMGFDIVLPGFDAATLMGKTIKVKGNLLPDHPPVFLADTVESGGQTVYTRSQEFQAEDFIEMKVREAVPALAITGVAKPEEWEGKGQAKVYGKLQKGDVNRIVLTDDKGRETAKIIVDSISTYADYYIQKLRLFDTFWFYLNVKESVDRRDRTRTKEIFHADVIGVGLF
ncbi:MAG: hypothetical protein EHM31_01980 [Candidatus Aminicenantes bacterium]|nr:MAG: hypothetical protein EHM31_06985 [Candidatus Aminicenantes bacterium]RPJ03048.1 MAG: hypothetical protein EHM31_01980 [Candidatus Aminicenantes bacterium]